MVKLPNSQSFFLFGPRGTGKTTLLHSHFSKQETLFIDLLDPEEEDVFARTPSELGNRTKVLKTKSATIIIDEIQKVPRLLDSVHRLMENSNHRFVLTGSSARKLKRGASNLLAGRAFVCHLHPFTHRELGDSFNLDSILRWGSLPGIMTLQSDDEKARFLRAYALTYLKEEIAAEQIVRNLQPFRQFLEVAAQSNGKIINFSRIATDVGVDTKTVQSYFTILEDTLVGLLLPAYHTSVRKRQRTNPKFYFFDTGVKRALERTVGLGLRDSTYAYGELFEQFVILEISRLNQYLEKDWSFSYLQTKDHAEIDLVIDRPGMATALVETKSGKSIAERDIRSFNHIAAAIPESQAFCLSRDPHAKVIGQVHCYHWKTGLETMGLT